MFVHGYLYLCPSSPCLRDIRIELGDCDDNSRSAKVVGSAPMPPPGSSASPFRGTSPFYYCCMLSPPSLTCMLYLVSMHFGSTVAFNGLVAHRFKGCNSHTTKGEWDVMKNQNTRSRVNNKGCRNGSPKNQRNKGGIYATRQKIMACNYNNTLQ